MRHPDKIKDLITRLARIEASESWEADLNPAQRAALDYLAQANRFSRSPSHAAAYLGTTRGTTTQTFKALARKGYVSEHRSQTDKRSISYNLTEAGSRCLDGQSLLERALPDIDPTERAQLDQGLQSLLRVAVRQNSFKPFGICRTCRHFQTRQNGGYCTLLEQPLEPAETAQICHEHELA
ncbi:MarR family transcriptional regulator [Aliiroseovarius sp. F47248L]|uniref:MarR family transcriptional regulator n=1 Tax=Aliiroseovarius sp. F47248L TaxID=2926420 RepID=UPI001FF626FA|nr:MarR family transcriptional regulator [Aliiroseovarius sp. F47248L]MCK0140666.1 MarR family transcriptional regulator [Aliiroseovarius sp. F47248L]